MLMSRSRSAPFLRLAAGLGLFLLALASTPAFAEGCNVRDAMGRIEVLSRSQEMDVQIVRASGGTEIAVPYHYLCLGDKVLRRGTETVIGIRWDGTATLEFVERSELTVPRKRSASLTSMARDWLARLGLITGGSRTSFARPTVARSGSGEIDGGELRLSKFSHDFVGVQRIAKGREVLAVNWQGAVLNLRLVEKEGVFLSAISVLGQPWAVIKAPQSSETMSLEFTAADRSTSAIEIARSGDIPALPGSDGTNSVDSQLAHALWLTYEAGPEWRLEGLSRLQELSNSSLIADHVWSSIVNGVDSEAT